jgi:hypothetical protein
MGDRAPDQGRRDITKAIPSGALVEVDPTAARPFIRLV